MTAARLKKGAAACICLALVGLSGCVCRLDLPETAVSVEDAQLAVEIAATPHARACGLAYRDHLPADRGMLFVLPEPTELSFWMANTRMPLSIAFLDEERRVISLQNAQPSQRKRRYRSPAPASYVIEASPDWFARHDVGEGDVFSFRLPGGSQSKN